jgi:hypothetical protein
MLPMNKDGLWELNDLLEAKNVCLRNVKNLSDPYYPHFIRKNAFKLFKTISITLIAFIKKG